LKRTKEFIRLNLKKVVKGGVYLKKISLVFSLLLFGLFGCQQNSESLEKKTIYSMESNSEALVIEEANTGFWESDPQYGNTLVSRGTDLNHPEF
jgi:hypothetical protein